MGVHKEQFYWPGLRKDVEDWCQQCRHCAEGKSPSTSARGPLSPSVVYPMECIALDVFGALPVTQRGNKHTYLSVTVTDKYVYLFPR